MDIPVLTEKDIDDLQNFGVKNKMDFVAASFVQSKADVLFIRKVLDEAGGQHVKIISKIENLEVRCCRATVNKAGRGTLFMC